MGGGETSKSFGWTPVEQCVGNRHDNTAACCCSLLLRPPPHLADSYAPLITFVVSTSSIYHIQHSMIVLSRHKTETAGLFNKNIMWRTVYFKVLPRSTYIVIELNELIMSKRFTTICVNERLFC